MNVPPGYAAARRVSMPLLVMLAVLTVAAGCSVAAAQSPSGAPVPTTGPAFDQLVSRDGRLSLSVPFGVDADISGLSIVRVLVTAPVIAAYELRPLGTSFAVPVMVSWVLDPGGVPPATNGDLIWLGMAYASHAAADAALGPWEWLADPHVAVVDGGYEVSGQLTRFGTLIVIQLPTLIHGPEAIWGPGYAPGRGIDVPLDLTLVTTSGASSTATFSGDWRFGGGYPDPIEVTTTVAEADRLAAVWRCLRMGATSLTTTFGVRDGTTDPGRTRQLVALGPAVAAFSVAFPVACGTVHANPNG
jgi:hypothetical protein